MKDLKKQLVVEGISESKSSWDAGMGNKISTVKNISFSINQLQDNTSSTSSLKDSFYEGLNQETIEKTSYFIANDKVSIDTQPKTKSRNIINFNDGSISNDNLEGLIERSLEKYVDQFQPQLYSRLDELFNKKTDELSKNNLLIESRVKSYSDEIKEKFETFDKNMDESKASILGSIAIFSGIISYISVSVTLFDKVQSSFEMVTILVSIMLALICFLTFLIASLKKQVNYLTYIVISLLSLFAVSIAFLNEVACKW